ncbi:exosortase system-associated protein, TIGR04073 family [Luteolibacter algae]|uniref:Exosortase system-associated protein, TIGR04073 family n=1 Tax=Luteolibacter algae TaxID=454151 RepID=A0ABW5D7D6_9BACT
MKKLLAIASTFIVLSGFAAGDIHAPPGSQYTSTRKLGRAVSNILYGFIEIPEQIVRKTDTYGRKAGWSYGAVDGTNRAFRRLGYGFYELITFTCPTYRGTFKPPYEKCGQDNRIDMNVHDGLSEFPPELGFETYFSHSRSQSY